MKQISGLNNLSCGPWMLMNIKKRKIENVVKIITQIDLDPLYKGFSMDQFRFEF